MFDKVQPKRRRNRIFKSLHKPLTYLGVERTLFHFVCVGAVRAFNLFNTLLAGIAVFVGGFAFGHWVTTSDPAFLPYPRPIRTLQQISNIYGNSMGWLNSTNTGKGASASYQHASVPHHQQHDPRLRNRQLCRTATNCSTRSHRGPWRLAMTNANVTSTTNGAGGLLTQSF